MSSDEVQWSRLGGDRVAQQQPPDRGTVTELTTAISAADLALALIDLSDYTVVSASQAWLTHLGRPAEAVIGRPAVDFVRSGKEAATLALRALSQGAIDVYSARRDMYAPTGSVPMSTVWLRGFEVGDRRLALVQAAPASDDALSPIAKHFGQESMKMAIGTINRDFTVTAMSCDIIDLLGVRPKDLVGQVLLDAVAHRDAAALLKARDRLAENTVGLNIHLRNAKQQWVALCCLLTSLTGKPDRCFMLAPAPYVDAEHSRVSELEQHLWRIASIVEASGVLHRIGPMRDMTTLPEVNNLSTRQWEVLARIVRGERVPTIAAELHVSQSTVRNHLSVIFKHFGVRSQPELLRVIEAKAAVASP